MKVVVDIDEFKSLVDKEFKWDKTHKKECDWDDHDISMIAEGMTEATNKLLEMVCLNNNAREVIYCKDCKYNSSGFCIYHETVIDENDFCSRGEK